MNRRRFASEEEWLPLSSGQQFHWDLSLRQPSTPDMKIVLAVLVKGYSTEALASAVRAVVHKHVSLRMRFRSVGGTWLQALSATEALDIVVRTDDPPSKDWSSREALESCVAWYAQQGLGAGAAQAVANAVVEMKAYPFDLTRELPTRAVLISHGEQTVSLVVGMHHAAADAYSFAPLLRDIAAFARGEVESGVVDERFLTYAYGQAARLRTQAETQLSYWSSLLRQNPRAAASSYLDGEAKACQVLAAQLADTSGGSRFRQAPFMGAIAQALQACDRLDETYVLTTTANRWSAAESDIVGCFYKHLVWRPPGGAIDPGAASRDFVGQTLRSARHLDVTLDMIIERYHQDTGAFPALQACLSFRDLSTVQLPGGQGDAFLPIPMLGTIVQQRVAYHMHVTVEPDRLSAAQVSRFDYLDASSAKQLFDEFRKRTSGVAAPDDVALQH
jgi:hypothetical protein